MVEIRYMRQAEVRQLIGNISRTKLYEIRRNTDFPEGIFVHGIRLWRCSDVINWVEKTAAANDNHPVGAQNA